MTTFIIQFIIAAIICLFLQYNKKVYFYLKYLWARYVKKEGWWISMSENCFDVGDLINQSYKNKQNQVLRIKKNKNYIKYYIIKI